MKSKFRITKETYIWTNENDEGVVHYKDGKEHREDGPAVELKDGTRKWFINGKLHREDGPAVIAIDEYGEPFYEWFRNGERVTEQEIEQLIAKKALNEKLHNTLGPRHKEKKKKI